MRKPRILVTGASGRNASAAVLELLKRGFPVRALVRRQDERSQALRAAGADIFVGDLFDYRDLERAMVDVQRAYHSAPYAPNLLHGMMLFAIAAEQAKLEQATTTFRPEVERLRRLLDVPELEQKCWEKRAQAASMIFRR